MNSPVQQIKERLSIEEIVSSYIKLDRAGANLKAKCPFHNEKTPSFFVSPDRGSYYCFGCGASGDIFTFVEEFEGLDFKGALKLLADRAGIQLTAYNKENKEADNEKEKLYLAMEEATKFFENNLKSNKQAEEYLKSRGLEEKTIKDFRIGFAKLDWRELCFYLQKKGFSDIEIEKAGLAKKTEKAKSADGGSPDPQSGFRGMYDRFRGRIMFPISDSSGRIIAFSGRLFADDLSADRQVVSQAKYLNSPETPIFSKSSVLYGLDKAKESIRKNNFSIVVEGQFDLILSHQAGFKNTVATSGTALVDSYKSEDDTINNLGLISRLSQNIIFIFDSDKAGFAASMRTVPIVLKKLELYDMNVKATQIPEGMDPADLISKKGPDAWREVIRNSKHIIELLVDNYKLLNKNNDVLKSKLYINDKIIPYLAFINNPVKKSHFISLISNNSGISENDIRERLKKIEQEFKYEKKEIEEAEESLKQIYRKDYILRKLLGIILWQKTLKIQNLNADGLLKEIAEIFKITIDEVLEKAKENKQDLIFEAEVFYGGDADIKKDSVELLSNLKEEYLKEELATKMRELNIAERDGDMEKSKKFLKECQVLNKRIQDIKNGRLNSNFL